MEEIAQRERMTTEECRDWMAMAYGWVEQRIGALADYKAGHRR